VITWLFLHQVYGGLPEGLLIEVSLPMACRLLRPDCAVLNALGKRLVFEVAVGMNGAVWFRASGGALETILIRNAILNAEPLTDLQAEAMVEQLLIISSKLAKR
jgi:exosome complex component RRP40